MIKNRVLVGILVLVYYAIRNTNLFIDTLNSKEH